MEETNHEGTFSLKFYKNMQSHLNKFFQDNICAQTLSNSVAEAISFLAKDIKNYKFRESEATV